MPTSESVLLCFEEVESSPSSVINNDLFLLELDPPWKADDPFHTGWGPPWEAVDPFPDPLGPPWEAVDPFPSGPPWEAVDPFWLSVRSPCEAIDPSRSLLFGGRPTSLFDVHVVPTLV